MEEIERELREGIEVSQALLFKGKETIKKIASVLVQCLRKGHTVYLMGHGGSAAEAQHIAGELIGRFKKDRSALPALAFSADSSVLTALANDYGFDSCFERQVEAFVKEGDVVLGLSTSGNSPAVLKALQLARKKGAATIGLTGQSGGKMKEPVDLCLRVPSDNTPRIQECHMAVSHVLCYLIEKELFGENHSTTTKEKGG